MVVRSNPVYVHVREKVPAVAPTVKPIKIPSSLVLFGLFFMFILFLAAIVKRRK